MRDHTTRLPRPVSRPDPHPAPHLPPGPPGVFSLMARLTLAAASRQLAARGSSRGARPEVESPPGRAPCEGTGSD